MYEYEWAMVQVGVALLVTLLLEVSVAALFRLRGRGLGAVVAVNLITNPALTVVIFALSGLGIGLGFGSDSGSVPSGPGSWAVLGLLEVVIIVAEWRMLVWALGGTAGSPRKLLAAAIVMNIVSATIGTIAVRYVMTLVVIPTSLY
jgi:hypothetical protein